MKVAPLRIRSVAPACYQAPPVEAFAAWVRDYTAEHPTVRLPSPAILRRLVLLRRAGDSMAECARCCGMTTSGARQAYLRLPEHLRPESPDRLNTGRRR